MRDVVAALSQLSAAQVRVINMSIVGPDNAVLAATVFHYGTLRIGEVKATIAAHGYPVRGLPGRVGPEA